MGPYQIPNVKVDVFCVHTNHPYGGQMRAPGCPQVNFACEQQMDLLAEALGIDPLEIRRINGLRIGSRTPWNQLLTESVGLMETLSKVGLASGWESRRARGRRGGDGRLRGFGVACCHYGTGNAYSPAEANIYLLPGGKIQIAAGVVDFGQGSKTVLSQIASETMQVPFSEFRVGAVDTLVDPFGGTSSSSRITMQGGKAVYLASLKARQEILRLAGALLEAEPDDLALEEGRVRSLSHPETTLSLADLAKQFVGDERKLIGASDSIPPPARVDAETGLGSPYEVYGFGTQAAEVLVDPETGEIEVVNVWAAHDVGKAISPLGVVQQIEGGVYMGLGFCLMEEIVQKEGRVLNPDMHGYLAPTVVDMPGNVEAMIVEDPYSNGPYGAKGVGEQVTVGHRQCGFGCGRGEIHGVAADAGSRGACHRRRAEKEALADSQVRLFDFLVGPELFRRGFVDHLPFRDDVDPVNGLDGEGRILLDKKNGEALVLQRADGISEILDDEGGEPLGGLIENQAVRVRHQRPADGEHLLLSAGKGAGPLVLALAEAGKKLVDGLVVPPGAGVGLFRDEEVFAHRQGG